MSVVKLPPAVRAVGVAKREFISDDLLGHYASPAVAAACCTRLARAGLLRVTVQGRAGRGAVRTRFALAEGRP